MTIKEILEFSKSRHKGQTRRDGKTPYFTHIERVVGRVTDYQEDENYWDSHKRKLAQIAALHDLIEDGRATRTDLMKLNLLEDVYSTVLLLTKDKYDDYLDYIREVRRNYLAKKVKIADILDNLSDAPTEKQIIKYAKALLILYGVED